MKKASSTPADRSEYGAACPLYCDSTTPRWLPLQRPRQPCAQGPSHDALPQGKSDHPASLQAERASRGRHNKGMMGKSLLGDPGCLPRSSVLDPKRELKVNTSMGVYVSDTAQSGGDQTKRTFYEFFAGGGMARAGLGFGWRCLFANDFDHKKSRVYRFNWGDKELCTASVDNLELPDIPGAAKLAWASFPCQDLSLAGGGAGLKGERSGTFWPFWTLMRGLVAENRAPEIIVLENVCGTLNSHEGKDFATICDAVCATGYSVGAFVVDAALFVPQSRPRLFIVCVRPSQAIPAGLVALGPVQPWHTRTLIQAHSKLPPRVRGAWKWWSIPLPPSRGKNLSDIIEDSPDMEWHSSDETRRIIAMMSNVNRAKLRQAQREKRRIVGGMYRRTRSDENGRKVQRAEIRFDDVSGCLRTPAGGSSRQVLVVVDG